MGIACLGLLVLAEVVQYIYGHRKDALQAVIASRQLERLQVEQSQDSRFFKQEMSTEISRIASLQIHSTNQLGRAIQGLQTAFQATNPRRLNAKQNEDIFLTLSPFARQRVTLLTPLGDSEALQYARDFAAILTRSGWVVSGPLWDDRPNSPPEIQIFIAAKFWGKGDPPAQALAACLNKNQVRWHGNLVVDAGVPDDSIIFVVGRKSDDGFVHAPVPAR